MNITEIEARTEADRKEPHRFLKHVAVVIAKAE